MPTRVPKDRFHGCLLGQAVGDALGAPFEGQPPDFIFWTRGPVHEVLAQPSPDELRYTDDTQMMIGVAETLVDHGAICQDALCRRFVENYEPDRGYGPGAWRILECMAAGGDWQQLADTIFPGGSFGNGAAMRVGPVGLVFCHDLARAAKEARASALPTHRHPLGIEGAQLLAIAIGLAVQGPPLDRGKFYDVLEAHCESDEFRWQLQAARSAKRHHSLSFLGNGLPAHRSVVTAIACFTTAPESFEQVIAKAIALGDDTDTLAAMAGALCGGYLGFSGIPEHWLERLETGPKGIHYLRILADKLYERYLENEASEGSTV